MNGGFGFRRPVVARTFTELKDQSEPWSPNQPAADPWIEYDVQLYTSAATTRLAFFQQTQATPDLSNIDAGGVLPFPNYLEIHGIVLDAYPEDGSWISNTADETGILDDIGRLIHSSRASWTLYIAGKTYGPFPLAACTGLSSPAGLIGWTVATSDAQQGTNGPRDMGFFVGGAWTIPPQQSYSVIVEWQTAVTLTVDDYKLRMGLVGTKYRKVS